MARFEYDGVNADYLRIKFQCTCGETNITDFIAAKESCKNNEVSYKTEHAFRCPHCKKLYNILLIDNLFEAVGEIFPLCDEDLIEVNEVPFEYANQNKFMFHSIAWIEGSESYYKLKNCLTAIHSMDSTVKAYLYEILYCNAITIMDSCCEKIVKYLTHYVPEDNSFIKDLPKNKIIKAKDVSYQNILSINSFFKNNYNQELPHDMVLIQANHIRNSIIHRLGRDKDGYRFVIDRSDVEEVAKHVGQYINSVELTVTNILTNHTINNQNK